MFDATHRTQQLQARLLRRAERLVSALDHIATSASDLSVLQHVVEELIGDFPEIKTIVVATHEPPRVVASTEWIWIGSELNRVTDDEIGQTAQNLNELVVFFRNGKLDWIQPIKRNRIFLPR